MDGTGNHHVEQDKPSSISQTSHVFTHVESRPKMMMMMMMMMGHQYKKETLGGGGPTFRGKGKEQVLRREEH
jgi:hypothetical protein